MEKTREDDDDDDDTLFSLNNICFVILMIFILIISCYFSTLFLDGNNDKYSSLSLINNNGDNDNYYYKHKYNKYYNKSNTFNDEDNIYLKLISFNLRNELLDNNDLNENKHWEKRKDSVYKLLNNIKGDIIGTQEGTFKQIEDISNNLHLLSPIYNNYGHYGLGRLPSNWYLSSINEMNEHCSIFWNKDKFILNDQGTFWLSDKPNVIGSKYDNSPLPRIATWMLLEIKNTEYNILFISTHLGLSQQIRFQQIKIIEKFINEFTSNSNMFTFVVGDFNEALNGDLWHQLFDNDDQILTDCIIQWEKIQNRTLNINFTYHAFEGMQHAKNDKNHAPIDWILCSKNVINNDDILLLDTYIVTEGINDSVYPSDHYPIVLELMYNQ